MYLLSGMIVFLFLFFIVLLFLFPFRKGRIVQKICSMEMCEKIALLNKIAEPFGFSYCPSQNIMTTTLDAWQREFGYRVLFDQTAPYFNMVFDCQRVYFEYEHQTWLIEFWKGQYGINVGAEIGIYTAGHLVSPKEYETTHFKSILNSQLFPLSIHLFYREQPLFEFCKCHWWLAGFSMGRYSEPEELSMRASITFPDCSILESFLCSMRQMGYKQDELAVEGLTLTFTFSSPRGDLSYSCQHRGYLRWVQWKNRLFCKLYRFFTKPFTCTVDQVLCLYFYLPFAFRHMFRFQRSPKQKCNRCRRKRRKGSV